MRRSWNIAFLIGSAARWSLALLVLLPLAVVLGAGLFLIWLLWLAVSALQGFLLRFSMPAPASRDRTSFPGTNGTAMIPGARRLLDLPPPTRRIVRTPAHQPRRHSLEDLQRSIAAMARHGWPKSKVIEALESAGAARMWSERTTSTDVRLPSRPAIPGERVHLRYRPGQTMFQRYTMPAARIDVFFDQAGRMVSGFANQDRRM